jgi:hypothetical protein
MSEKTTLLGRTLSPVLSLVDLDSCDARSNDAYNILAENLSECMRTLTTR